LPRKVLVEFTRLQLNQTVAKKGQNSPSNIQEALKALKESNYVEGKVAVDVDKISRVTTYTTIPKIRVPNESTHYSWKTVEGEPISYTRISTGRGYSDYVDVLESYDEVMKRIREALTELHPPRKAPTDATN
jgi:hypothetical protein